MAANRNCPDFNYCKSLCGFGCNPLCEPRDQYRRCSTHIKNHKAELPELYRLIHQT